VELKPLGGTALKPETYFLWEPESSTTVEITKLSREHYLLRATRSYRLLKQGKDGRETWSRKLTDIHSYLKSNFSSFQINVNFTSEVAPEVLGIHTEAEEKALRSAKLNEKVEQLEKKIKRLERSTAQGFEELKPQLEQQTEKLNSELEEAEKELVKLLNDLEKKEHQQKEWLEAGTMLAYTFSFSTDPVVCRRDELAEVIESSVNDIEPGLGVKQTLQGSNFDIFVELVDEPSVINRLEYNSLLNPVQLKRLKESNPRFSDTLERLEQRQIDQFEAYTTRDLETADGVFESQDSTPARAIQSIITELDTQQVSLSSEYPDEDPFIGNIPGTERTVGFKPTEAGPHFYIVGETGSGKSHTKRVLIENIASLGSSILTINPGDKQNIGLNLENKSHSKGIALSFDQYSPEEGDGLPGIPNDETELFEGLNAVTLVGMSEEEKQEIIQTVFKQANELDLQHRSLFIILDEAHNFNEGEAAESIQDAVREGRKFGVNIILVSQSPKDFIYNYKKVRENTVNIFHKGEYFDYADRFIDSGQNISGLERGQAIFPSSLDWNQFTVSIRDTLTRMWDRTPSEKEIERVAKQFDGELPQFQNSTSQDEPTERSISVSEDERILLRFIKSHTEENDEAPTYSQCHREQDSPFGSSKTKRLLEQLVDKNLLKKREETRYGNECNVYIIDGEAQRLIS